MSVNLTFLDTAKPFQIKKASAVYDPSADKVTFNDVDMAAAKTLQILNTAILKIASGGVLNVDTAATLSRVWAAAETDAIAAFVSGAGGQGKLVKTDGTSGLIVPSLLTNPISIVHSTMSGDVTTSVSYATLASVAATITTGVAFIFGRATFSRANTGTSPGVLGADIYDGSAQLDATALNLTGDARWAPLPLLAIDTSPSGKTYSLRGIVQTAQTSHVWLDDGQTQDDSDIKIVQGCKLVVIQVGT